MKATEQQKNLFNKAIELLTPFDKENESYYLVYYEHKENDCGVETCDADKCVKAALKDIRKDIGKYSRISVHYSGNDGDHEKVALCAMCDRPLNRYLTWLSDEFDHHVNHNTTKEKLTDSLNAFELIGFFESVGWAGDFGYIRDEKEREKKRDELVERIAEYAELVIKELGGDSASDQPYFQQTIGHAENAIGKTYGGIMVR